MKVKDKLFMELSALDEHGPITIVALGDSVTHGSVAAGEINYETVYWNRLRQKLNAVRATIPVNVINAGIGGTTAARSVARLDRQVLCHNPDLVIVCFGLNDINGTREQYLDSLRTIFTRCRESGAEVIFMTPNMLNTRVDERTEARFAAYAVKTAEMQNGGRMDLYMESACALAREMDVTVCDCYAKWKELSRTQDITDLLANYINHPTREMHELFAQSLFEIIMGD
jgi:lysophospholipase L1-like esterase